MMTAQDIMTKNVIMVEEVISVAEAIDIMTEKIISSLIVNRLNEHDSYGIVTRRDVVNKVVAERLDPQKLIVADIATKPLLTIPPDLSIKHIARLMMYTGVRRLPVFDSRQIRGIVSNSDIFRAFGGCFCDEKTLLD